MSEGPFSSREVRWFFEGPPAEHGALVDWFSAAVFGERDDGLDTPGWRQRLDGEPDVYLVVPDSDDMGIKWREGLLQIKGRVASLGVQAFAGHKGMTDRWLKWSYAGLPPAWRELFTDNGSGRVTLRVHKQRMLRLLRIDKPGIVVECAPETRVGRGVSIELTDISIREQRFLTLGFEAFPDDRVTADCFDDVVADVLATLTDCRLEAEHSRSYPGWLTASCL